MTEKVCQIPEQELYELYSILADATEAAATGDPNTCASKASDAKERVQELRQEYPPEEQE